MRQFISTLVSAGILSLAAYAGPIGQVQLGGVNGLTSAYLSGANANGTNGCNNIGAAATNVGCQGTIASNFGTGALGASSSSDFRKLNYTTGLFSTPGTITPLVGGALPDQNAANPTTSTLTDNTLNGGAGVTFNLLNDGLSTTASNGVANYWAQTKVTDALTIPVGVFGVDKAWTMLSETYGLSGVASADIQFVFGSQSNTTDAGSFHVQIGSASSSTAVGATDMLTGVECDPAHPNTSPVRNCAGFGVAGTQATGAGPSNGSAGISNLWTGTFDVINGQGTPFTGATNGTLTLSDQTFLFSNYAASSLYLNNYLTEIIITDTSFCGTSDNTSTAIYCPQGASRFSSRVGISAVTVNSTFDANPLSNVTADATPEPTTMLLLGAGLGGLLIVRRRA